MLFMFIRVVLRIINVKFGKLLSKYKCFLNGFIGFGFCKSGMYTPLLTFWGRRGKGG